MHQSGQSITFLCPGFFPSNGGVERHVDFLAHEFRKRDNNVSVIRLSFEAAATSNSHEIYKLTGGRLRRRLKLIYYDVAIFLKHVVHNRSVMHFHDYATVIYFPLTFILCGLFARDRLFVTFHGWEGVFPPKRSIVLVKKFINFLVSKSLAIGHFIPKWYGVQCDEVTYGAVLDTNKFDNIEHKGENARKRLLFIGRLENDSGILSYISGLTKLNDYEAYELIICGDGSMRNIVEQLCFDLKLSYAILGFVNNIEEEIIKSDIILTSGYLAILESLYAKKNIVSIYNNSLKKDYLTMMPGSADFLSIAHSPEEIANMITKIDPSVENTAGYMFAKNYTISNLVCLYSQMWNEK